MNATTTTTTTSARPETPKGAPEGQPEARPTDPRKMSRAALEALGHGQPILKAVRQNCIDCSGGNSAEVTRCGHMKCPMWPFRMGTNPLNRRTITEEQRAALVERLKRG